MAVRASDPERADAGHQPAVAARPVPGLAHHLEPQLAERDRGVGSLEVQAGRQRPVGDRQRRLDEPGDAGRALQVPDVGLHRADEQRVAGRAARTQGGAERRRLDRVADAGAGPVQLDVLDLARLDAGMTAGPPQQLPLGRLAGHRQLGAAAVVVDRPAQDDAVDRIAGGQRGREPLQHDDGAALAAHVPVGAVVERPAAAVGGEGAGAADRLGGLRHQHQVDPARERQVHLAPAQLLAGQLHRQQRRALAGVHRQAGPAQAEEVGDAVREQGPEDAGERVGAGAEPVVQDGVVVVDRADHDGRLAVSQRGRRDPGPLQRLPGQLQRQALLRVHRRRLARRDTEERGVEPVHLGQEPAAAIGRGAGVPPVRRHLRHRVAPGSQQPPELVRVARPGQPAGDADDRDGLLGPGDEPRGRHDQAGRQPLRRPHRRLPGQRAGSGTSGPGRRPRSPGRTARAGCWPSPRRTRR